jgi:phosphoglycerate dehydrogenase-like enzyme
MRVVVLDDYQQVAADMAPWDSLPADVAFVHEPLLSDEALVDVAGNAEIVVAMRERTAFTATRFDRLPALRLLVTTGMRNAAIDLEAARSHDVVVCGTGAIPSPTSEHTWALLLALARHVPEEHQRIRDGGWQSSVGFDLAGKTLGLAGLGNLGGQVARVGAAFGMHLIAWSANLSEERCAEVGARLVDRDELFRTSDVLTIHLVLSERTRGLVGARELSLMKPSALLVNTSRGPVVDAEALAATVQKRGIAGAALDVYDTEPLPPDSPLRALPNVVLTPHLGYVTENNYRIFYGEAVEDINAWFAGNPTRVLT